MRARDYVMKGRVLNVKANADFRHIEGLVSGTERAPYRQDIRLVSVNHKLIMNGFVPVLQRGIANILPPYFTVCSVIKR